MRGVFGHVTGSPYIAGRVFFPRFGVSSDITFIVDTGADNVLVMPRDARSLGIDFHRLVESLDRSVLAEP